MLLQVLLAFTLYSLREALETTRSRLVDLTHEFDNSTIVWVAQQPFRLNVTHFGPEGDTPWFQTDQILSTTHAGTHFDAPCHFSKGAPCVTGVPLSALGPIPAVVVDVSGDVGDNPDVHLDVQHLKRFERTYGRIPDGALVLVNTGWARFWPNKRLYSGTNSNDDETKLRFPSITPEAARWMLNHRNINGLAIDTMSMDIPNRPFLVHETILGRNKYGVENVANLGSMPPTGAVAFVMPMKIEGASGAPCRLVALVQE